MELKEIAKELNGTEDRNICKKARDLLNSCRSSIVVVYPYSDDLIEFEGAIHDELDAKTIHLNKKGIIKKICEDEDCPYEKDLFINTPFQIHQLWRKREGYSWTYETNIPNAEKFIIMERDEDGVFGEGLVFDMKDLQLEQDNKK